MHISLLHAPYLYMVLSPYDLLCIYCEPAKPLYFVRFSRTPYDNPFTTPSLPAHFDLQLTARRSLNLPFILPLSSEEALENAKHLHSSNLLSQVDLDFDPSDESQNEDGTTFDTAAITSD